MKRLDLIRHLEANGCEFLREGGSHTVAILFMSIGLHRDQRLFHAIVRLTTYLLERYVAIYKCQIQI